MIDTKLFDAIKAEVSKDVPSYCLSYVKKCSVGITDENMTRLFNDMTMGDIRAMLGYLAVQEVAKIETSWTMWGNYLQSNIIDLCKESVYSDSTCDVNDEKIPHLNRLTNITGDYYLAKGQISNEAIVFLAHVKAWKV